MSKTDYKKRIVAFMDILGFKNIVENTNKAFSIIEVVRKIKKSKKDLIKELSIKEIEVTWFSDCIVISAPLDIYYIKFVLELIKEMQCDLIRHKILIRGGIEIGDCFHKNEKLFGPAMNEAYRLESKIAIVPRIVLSNNLINYINESDLKEKKIQDSKFDQDLKIYSEKEIEYISESYLTTETIASEIKKYIILKDKDGYYFVDYLEDIISESIHRSSFEKEEIYDNEGNLVNNSYQHMKSVYHNWYKDIIEPLQEFIKENQSGKNMNVLSKYVWLKDYYNRSVESYKSDLSPEFERDLYSKLFV